MPPKWWNCCLDMQQISKAASEVSVYAPGTNGYCCNYNVSISGGFGGSRVACRRLRAARFIWSFFFAAATLLVLPATVPLSWVMNILWVHASNVTERRGEIKSNTDCRLTNDFLCWQDARLSIVFLMTTHSRCTWYILTTYIIFV